MPYSMRPGWPGIGRRSKPGQAKLFTSSVRTQCRAPSSPSAAQVAASISTEEAASRGGLWVMGATTTRRSPSAVRRTASTMTTGRSFDASVAPRAASSLQRKA
jgi:hypothetical protein